MVHVVTPATPTIAHTPLAVGATAPLGPVTVAVKVIVVPNAAEMAFAVTVTAGLAFATEVVEPEVKLVPE